jgi:hypothetical protein
MSQWFTFGNAKFLIRPLNPFQILKIRDSVAEGRISEEQAMYFFFSNSLAGFKGMEGGKKISRRRKVEALFADVELRVFVLEKAYGLLEETVSEIEKLNARFAKFLFGTADLKYKS